MKFRASSSSERDAPTQPKWEIEDEEKVLQGILDTSGAVKSEPMAVDTPALKAEDPPTALKESSPDGTLDDRPSATPPVSSRARVKAEAPGPQLIGHLPVATDAAMQTFVPLEQNHYQFGYLGRSREALESMTCECQYEHGVDDASDACGPDCINRLTQVECLEDDCRCRSYCQNQRFQRKQYAPIEIVQTEKKGFGLRAEQDMPKDTFVYEYIGDVVNNSQFLKRMRQYAGEGIRHFYFMMLQKDEFIDATKRGGIGRFANHSCNPNCYVAKWTIGEHVRMGIFTKRSIRKHEELTFNYNVDRYGHDAQPCYCGESNCVGFIGGKTQTDIAAMDDLYLDALGISEDVAALGLKGSKKKKSKKLDEDFIPTLKPLQEKDVPKVVQAMRQTQSRKVLFKLLTRIKMTEDQSPLRQIMRLRGFSVMTNILEDYKDDHEVLILAMGCMMTWPLLQRNKVEDSKVNAPVQELATSEAPALAEPAQKLLAQWEALEYAYRIPKRLKGDDEPDAPPVFLAPDDDARASKRSRLHRMDDLDGPLLNIRPLGRNWSVADPRPVAHSADSNPYVSPPPPPSPPRVFVPTRAAILAVIAAAASAQPQPSTSAAPESEEKSDEGKKGKERERRERKKVSPEEREANKEKRLLKLVGAVVVKCMSKYREQMDHDTFKKHAKELTHVISEKEKKSSSYKEGRLDALSDDKTAKIKKFAKEYVAKVLRKLDKAGKRRKPSAAASTSADADEDDGAPVMSVEEAMDMAPDGDGDAEGEGEEDSPHTSPQGSSTPPIETPDEPQGTAGVVTDPRLRHRSEGPWDTHLQKVNPGMPPDLEGLAGAVAPW